MTLTRRQLYMLPTRYGLWFAFVLLVLFIAGINYENGLVHALTFLLGCVAIVSMLYTHRNVLDLQLSAGACPAVFLGETARFSVALHNPTRIARFAINVDQRPAEGSKGIALVGRLASRFGSSATRAVIDSGWRPRAPQSVDLAPLASTTVTLEAPTMRRGFVEAPTFRVSTRYPISLFYTWSRNLALPARCLVYPRPGPARPLPITSAQMGQHAGAKQGDDDFAGLRQYVLGDAPGHVHWKAFARGQGLLTKQFAGAQVGPIWLDWDAAEGGIEERLSQLCRWALDADRLGLHFGLRLPAAQIPLGHGPAHLARCLEALAHF